MKEEKRGHSTFSRLPGGIDDAGLAQPVTAADPGTRGSVPGEAHWAGAAEFGRWVAGEIT
jgi:hypothetical protein